MDRHVIRGPQNRGADRIFIGKAPVPLQKRREISLCFLIREPELVRVVEVVVYNRGAQMCDVIEAVAVRRRVYQRQRKCE